MSCVGEALLALCMLRQKTIQAIRELLFVTLTERGRPAAGINATCPHGVEEVPHVEPGTDILGGVHLAARAQCVAAFFDHFRGKRNVARDDEVTGFQSLDDFVVGDIESPRDLKRVYVWRKRRVYRLVRNQRQLHTSPIGGPEKDLLGDNRTGVCINPYFHLMMSRA